MFDVGFTELVLLFVIGLLILGPERMPRVATQIGRWVGRARRTANQLRHQLEREIALDDMAKAEKRAARESPTAAGARAEATAAGTAADDTAGSTGEGAASGQAGTADAAPGDAGAAPGRDAAAADAAPVDGAAGDAAPDKSASGQ